MNAETRKQNEIMPSGIIKLDAMRGIDGAMGIIPKLFTQKQSKL